MVGGVLFCSAAPTRADEAAGSAAATTANASSGSVLMPRITLPRVHWRASPSGLESERGSRVLRRLLAKMVVVVVPVGAALGIVSAATSASLPAVKASSALGSKIVVTSTGLTLYHDTAEKKGTISCTGACAKVWVPLLATGKPLAGPGLNAGKLGTIKRPDGKIQGTYNGVALYRYASDKAAGQTKGQGAEGIWFAVTAAGSVTKKTQSASGGGTSGSGGGTSSGGG